MRLEATGLAIIMIGLRSLVDIDIRAYSLQLEIQNFLCAKILSLIVCCSEAYAKPKKLCL